jgi:hypothetical protein
MKTDKDNDNEPHEGRDEKGRFVAGNKFSEGLTNNGAPPLYENSDQMFRRAKEYFDTTRVGKTGAYKPTITGLCYHLGFQSAQSFYDYEERSPEWNYAINRLRLFVKSCYETQLYGFAWAGASFALKNIGRGEWSDEVIQQQNQTITMVNPVVKDSGTPLADKED